MQFDFPRRPPTAPSATVKGFPVEALSQYKYLGAVLDDQLTFETNRQKPNQGLFHVFMERTPFWECFIHLLLGPDSQFQWVSIVSFAASLKNRPRCAIRDHLAVSFWIRKNWFGVITSWHLCNLYFLGANSMKSCVLFVFLNLFWCLQSSVLVLKLLLSVKMTLRRH